MMNCTDLLHMLQTPSKRTTEERCSRKSVRLVGESGGTGRRCEISPKSSR